MALEVKYFLRRGVKSGSITMAAAAMKDGNEMERLNEIENNEKISRMFNPKSIAIVGVASRDSASEGESSSRTFQSATRENYIR